MTSVSGVSRGGKSPRRVLSEKEKQDQIDKAMQVKQQRSTVITNFNVKSDYFKPKMAVIEEEKFSYKQ